MWSGILCKENFTVITPFKTHTSFFSTLHFFLEFINPFTRVNETHFMQTLLDVIIGLATKEKNFLHLILSIYFIHCIHNRISFLKFVYYSNNGSFTKRQMSGTSSYNEWNNEWQRMTTSVATNVNEWQRVV